MSLVWIIVLMAAAFGLVAYTSFSGTGRRIVAVSFWVIFAIATAFGIVKLVQHWPGTEAPIGFFWFTVLLVISFAITMYLILRSGHNYSVHDTESHAADYGNVIKEGHGGLTAFLWLSYAAMFIWTVIYLVQHWSEFEVIFSY